VPFLRQKTDEEGADFDGTGGARDIYLCAEELEEGKYLLYEQIDGVDREGPHDINRKVVVTEEFIEKLNERVNS
jgi:hypothetical protein